ncbi:hypothetical protein [Metamycoplasma equirhinis]|uniref:hypothetical protein n=1 Tax=Metamycoplasma equirhinis TaxID=92402 RepID=UPI0035946CB5
MKSKNRKITKAIVALSTSTALGVASLLSSSCITKNKKNNNENEMINADSQKIIEGNVKYLALGDDYAAGNNSSFNNFTENKYDEAKKKIIGISYASYLANAINELNDAKTKLVFYKNYGLSGSTIDHWLHILDSRKYQANDDFNAMTLYNQKTMQLAKSNKLENLFGKFEDKDFQKIRNEIKNANLLTISLGFNDLFDGNSLFQILFNVIRENDDTKKLEANLKEIVKVYEQKSNAIVAKYVTLLSEVRKINPNANINVIGYASPYLRLTAILKNQINHDYIGDITKKLNSSLREASKNAKVNFVSFKNENMISENTNKFSDSILDFLPTNNTYKKLAQDIFVKLSLSKKDYEALISKNNTNDSDNNSYSQALLFKTHATAIKSNILGLVGENIDTFSKSYSFEKLDNNKKLIDSKREFNILSNIKLSFNNGKNITNKQLIYGLGDLLKLVNIDLNELKNLLSFMEKEIENSKNREFLINIINSLLDSKTLQNNIASVAKKIDNLILEKSYSIKLKDIMTIFKSEFQSINNIYLLTKEIANTKLSKNGEGKKLVKNFINAFINDILVNKTYKKVFGNPDPKFQRIFDDKSFVDSIKALAEKITVLLVDEPEKYFESDSYVDFLSQLVKDTKSELKELLKTTIGLLKKDKVLFEEVANKFTDILIKLNNIETDKTTQVKKFTSLFLDNLDKFDEGIDLLYLGIHTFIDEKNNEKMNFETFISKCINNVISDKYPIDSKSGAHDLLFSIISLKLGKDDSEQAQFIEGLKATIFGYIKQNNILDPKNLGSILNNSATKTITKLMLDLLKNKNGKLTADGKKIANDIVSSIIEKVMKEDSLYSNTIKSLLKGIIVKPIFELLNKKNLQSEKINEKTIDSIIEANWEKIFAILKSNVNSEKINKIFSYILENGKKYNLETITTFTIDLLKDIKNNGILEFVNSTISSILQDESILSDVLDVTISLAQKDLNLNIKNEDIAAFKKYLTEVIKNIPNSNIYNKFIEYFIKTLESVKSDDSADFSKFINYLLTNLSKFASQGIANDVIDLLLAKNKDGQSKVEFKDFVKSLKILLGNKKIVELILSKIDLKNVLFSQLNSFIVKPGESGIELQQHISTILSSLKLHLESVWNDEILNELNDIIVSSFSSDKLDNANNVTELITEIIALNKQKIAKLIGKVTADFLSSDENNIKAIVSLLKTFLPSLLPGFNIKAEYEGKLVDFLAHILKFAKEKNIFETFVSSTLENVISLLKDKNTTFNLQSITKLLPGLLGGLKDIFKFETLKEAITNYLSKEDVLLIFNLIFDNKDFIIKKLLGEENSASKNATLKQENSQTITSIVPQYSQGEIVQLFQAIWKKLDIESQKLILEKIADILFELKDNEKIVKLLSSEIAKAIKKWDENFAKEIAGNNSSIEDHIHTLIKDILNTILANENKESIKKLIISLKDANPYNAKSLVELLLSFVPQILRSENKDLIKNIISKIWKNKKLPTEISNWLFAYLKTKANIQISEEDKTKIKEFIEKIFEKIPETKLFNELFDNLFKAFNKEAKSEEIVKKLLDALKQSIDFSDQGTINQITEIFKFDEVLAIIKLGFKILKSNENKEKIKTLLTSLVEKFQKSQGVKNLVNNALNNLKQTLIKSDPKLQKVAEYVAQALNEIIFSEDLTKKFMIDLGNLLINLTDEEIDKIKSINDIFKLVFEKSKESLKELSKKLLDKLLKEEQVKEIVAYVIDAINAKYSLTLSGIDQDNIKSLLSRLILSDGTKNIAEKIIGSTIDTLANVNIFNEQNKINPNEIKESLLKSVKQIKFDELFSTENLKKLFEDVFGKNISKEQLYKELISLYTYISNNISKLISQGNKIEKTEKSKKISRVKQVIEENNNNSSFWNTIEKAIINALKAFTEVFKKNENAKQAIVEVAQHILKDQSQKIDYSKINIPGVDKDKLKKVIEKVINYEETKELIKSVVEEYLSQDNLNSNKLGDILSNSILKIGDKLKANVTKIITKFSQDQEIVNILIKEFVKYLSLENVNQEDKKFLSDFIGKVVPKFLETEIYKRKILNRLVTKFAENAKSFSLQKPGEWVTSAIKEFASALSTTDVLVTAELIGKDKVINGEILVKLINLLLGKSKSPDSFIMKALNNINMNANENERTNLASLNKMIKDGIGLGKKAKAASVAKNDEDNISPNVDYLKLADTIFQLLAGEVDNESKKITNYNTDYFARHEQPAYQATYRLFVTLNWVIFEMFGRETKESERDKNGWFSLSVTLYKGSKAILWEIQEASNIGIIPGIGNKFGGMKKYFTNEKIRREFTNYCVKQKSTWFSSSYEYAEENNYTPDSIMYLITSSGYHSSEKNKLKEFKYKIDESGKKVSKREYILLTIKEGGYGKFMKLNKQISIHEWSGMNKVKFNS